MALFTLMGEHSERGSVEAGTACAGVRERCRKPCSAVAQREMRWYLKRRYGKRGKKSCSVATNSGGVDCPVWMYAIFGCGGAGGQERRLACEVLKRGLGMRGMDVGEGGCLEEWEIVWRRRCLLGSRRSEACVSVEAGGSMC